MSRQSKEALLKFLASLSALFLFAALTSRFYRKGLFAIDPIFYFPIGLAAAMIWGTLFIRRKAQPLSQPEQKRPSPEELARIQSAEKIIAQLRNTDWSRFEHFIGALYGKLGYSVTQRGGANPDGGIDLIIESENECSAVQCKQWKTRDVGVKEIREFLGALTAARLKQGYFVTLTGYSPEAKQLAENNGITIVHEKEISRLIQLAESDDALLAILNDPKHSCPKCGREMELYAIKQGTWSSSKQWRCTGFPDCQQTLRAAA